MFKKEDQKVKEINSENIPVKPVKKKRRVIIKKKKKKKQIKDIEDVDNNQFIPTEI